MSATSSKRQTQESGIKLLKKEIEGVKSSKIERAIYSVDASIFEIEPLAVVVPKSLEDLLTTVQIAKDYQIPIAPRGAATGITGGCLTSGIVIDLSQHFTKIEEINIDERYVICQPGVVQDALNQALKPFGYRLGPDTSTGSRATLGGMVGNNSAGSRSLKFGSMVDHILSCDAILSEEGLQTFSESIYPVELHKKIETLLQSCEKEIIRKFPPLPRRVSGYCLDKMHPFNLAKLFCGAEGTLGIITKMKLNICPIITNTKTIAFFFNSLQEAFEAISLLLLFNPVALEMIDQEILNAAKSSNLAKHLLSWLKGDPKAVILMECNQFESSPLDYKILTPSEVTAVFEVRKKGLELLLSRRSFERALAFIEDIALPPEKLAPFMKSYIPYLQSQFSKVGIYGHVGAGCIHIRPFADLRDPVTVEKMEAILKTTTNLLKEAGGTLSGEHGDGLIRSYLNQPLFGDKIYSAFKTIKESFDPYHIMNPGKIVTDDPPFQHLKSAPLETTSHTFLNFSKEGGLPLSVDLCNGNGNCRKKEGLMCPSFQATNNEYDSTKGRAQALRALFNGKLPETKIGSQEIVDILDLCLECKGCKKECPVSIDMAKIKAESLYQHQESFGYSVSNRLFGSIGQIFNFFSKAPRLFNFFGRLPFGKSLLNIAAKRPLPKLVEERFSEKFAQYQQPKLENAVALFNDTYLEFVEPELGMKTVKLLNSLGFFVHLPAWSCCGRPAFSKGLLKKAKRSMEAVSKTFTPFVLQNIPIVGLEPSCASMILEDTNGLDVKSLPIELIDAFLLKHLEKLPALNGKTYLIHTHCHQKATDDDKNTYNLLKKLGANPIEIPSGCCGMAGSFGYEKNHQEISKKIAELKLLPFLDDHPDIPVIANGISCRSQIAFFRNRPLNHLVEILSGEKTCSNG